MRHYMAELILTHKELLVIGGGAVARRKIAGLLPCGGHILVVAPRLDLEVAGWVAEGRLAYQQAVFLPELLDREPAYCLVFAATGDREVNRQIALACAARGLWCNSADDPGVSGFLVPATVRRGPVTVAVGTQGESPALSRLLKERLERWLESGWGPLAQVFGSMRERVKAEIHPIARRQCFWRQTALAAERENRFDHQENAEWFEAQLAKEKKKKW